ncbi:hypothetical protein GCM10010921_23600 [Microbacterium album]|uniref:DUF4232 domain-containing protein n=1 Tax=Microbacterium album TaxID=2053191 RepID=A0A917IIA0_9MICO|nr:hypothetical protein GCM10010921_23600 [Microbacterium album]
MLLIALLVVAGVVWAVIAQPWRGLADLLPQSAPEPTASAPASSPRPTGSPTPTESPAPTESPEPSESPDDGEPPAPQPCDPHVIEVVPLINGERFRTRPIEFSIQLTNTGSVDCTMNVGTSVQQFVVTSGTDTWWRSTDCQREPSDMVVTLAAGQTVTSAEPLVWDRTRSSVDTCDSENRPRAPGGGATYHLKVRVGEVESASMTRFFLY